MLARRGAFKSERIPASYARQVQVDPCRHVWSFWNALSKKQRGVSRHSFFSRDANSIVEVSLSDESTQATVGTGSRGSPSDTSTPRRDSSARADKTARSATA